LHETGSNNPLGINRNINKIIFFPYFIIKDLIGYIIILIVLIIIITFNPFILRDRDNFILANPIITPEHIQPEWYFLFAYAILRSIPRKLGGVIALLISILILFFLPILNLRKIKRNQFYFIRKFIFWMLFFNIIILTWIGIKPVDNPYIFIGQILSIIYFIIYFINPIIQYYNDKLIN